MNIQRMHRSNADTRDLYRGYSRRRDAWGKGLVPGKSATFVGLMGEHAVAVYLSRRGFPMFADVTLRPCGDGGADIHVVGLRLQVKTRRKGLGGRNYVRRVDRGRIVPFNCDAFVFAQWDETPTNPVLLLGWAWRKDVATGTFERSPIGAAQHWNLRIQDVDLQPMSRLVDELIARKDIA